MITDTLPQLCPNLSADTSGRLLFAGQSVSRLAATYGTPLYLMDEDRIRERCRTYRAAAAEAFDGKARIVYASKAASFKRIYEIMQEEDMDVDVVSPGEIATACRAGFPMERAYFHSSHKSDADIRYAMERGVGYFVVDCTEELLALEKIAAERGARQKLLLRLTPGIDPHTYEAVATGKVDSKFGFAIATGQAEEITRLALAQPHLELVGFHSHVGSQVFDSEVFLQAADILLEFMAAMRDQYGYVPTKLDLGGGYGVRYVPTDPELDIAANLRQVGAHVRKLAEQWGLPMPEVLFEPGRSIVADAGLTLYTVSSLKRIPGYKNYVSVDGGMTDNPRFALYRAPYTLLAAEKLNEPAALCCSVVGRCCESGDVLQENVSLPESIARGDLLACLTTGAYNYSMASNYNRVPRPPVVMMRDGDSYVAVRRETPDDVLALDV